MAKLTEKQEVYCQQYLITGNKSEAYRIAFNCEKMKPHTINTKAVQLFNVDKIRARVEQLQKERNERNKVDADYVLNRLVEIDQLDVLDILTDDLSAIRPLKEWPKAWRTSISGIDVNELFDYANGEKELTGLVKKIKFPDKTKNLELLGKHIGVQAFKEKVDLNANQTHNVMLVPSAGSVDDWEEQAKKQQSDILSEHE